MPACRNGLSNLPCRLRNALYLNAESEFRVLPIPPFGLSLYRTRSRRARPCPFSRGIRKPEPGRRRREKELDARTGTLYEQTLFGGRRRPGPATFSNRPAAAGPAFCRAPDRRIECEKNMVYGPVCIIKWSGRKGPDMTKHDIS